MSEDIKVGAAKPRYKQVRALRQGSYDGHRRRAGAEFTVPFSAKEKWFEDIAGVSVPEDYEPPSQLQNAQAPRGKDFITVMKELGNGPAQPAGPPVPMTLAEGAAQVIAPQGSPADDSDLA